MSEERESRRVGPFYKPKKLTPEEINARKLDKAKKMQDLETMIKIGEYDRPTTTIAKILAMMNFSAAKLYLWRFQLFNSAIVEATGLMIYYAFLPMFQAMGIHVIIAITFTAAISFFCKFVVYSMWMFKKVKGVKTDTSNKS